MSVADNNRRTKFMSRTIRTKVYKFNELNETAKEKAIESYRNVGIDVSYIYDEAHETVKAFHKIFGTDEGSRSWLDVDFSGIDNNILELKGLRLRTYIINNFWSYLYKGKYYNYKSNTKEKLAHKRIKSIYYGNSDSWGNYYYSAITFEKSCTLTGVCYDMSLLQPIYEFLEWKLRPDYNSYMDFETLINDCFDSLRKDLDSEEDYRNSDEAIAEDIKANEYEFTKDGKIFNQ
jgi:hypothetical protein